MHVALSLAGYVAGPVGERAWWGEEVVSRHAGHCGLKTHGLLQWREQRAPEDQTVALLLH